MTTPAAAAELATLEAVSRWGTVSPVVGEDEVVVVALAPHKVGAPRTPDDRVKYWPGQQYVCTRAQAEYAASRGLVHIPGAVEYDWWGAPRRVLSSLGADARPFTTRETPGALRIAMGVGYDPGSCCYRTASAINQHSKHAVMFARWGDTNPHSSYRQWDGEQDAGMVRAAVDTADVLHNHMGYFLLNNTGLARKDGQVLVLHYHGSRPDYAVWPIRSGTPLCADRLPDTGVSCIEWDAMRGARIVGARLQLCDEIRAGARSKGVPIEPDWLPIPMPVEEYAALVTRPAWDGRGTFRIAHSPTNRRFKGSDQYDTVTDRLIAKGLPIERVTIMGLKHADALRLKATCHATFDSFWLGMQGSGLEAACMGQPVLAGDSEAARAHREFCGHVPYTYTPDTRELHEAIERLVTDVDYYHAEAARVRAFVDAHHSYPAVARRYEVLLAKWTGRDDVTSGAVAVPDETPKSRRKRKVA